MAELKPCPFCGGKAKIVDEHIWISGKSNGGKTKYVICEICCCRTSGFYWEDRNEMIKTWNERAGEND